MCLIIKIPVDILFNFVLFIIGKDKKSWGISYKGDTYHGGVCTKQFCEPFYDAGTVIGVHLDLYSGHLSFYKNREYLGVAYTGLNKIKEPLYPVISSTTIETEITIGVRQSRFLSLQEQCFVKVAHCLQNNTDSMNLPLPKSFQQHLLTL